MKRFLISILVLCSSILFALEMVNSSTLQLVTVPNPLEKWNIPDVKIAQQYGYLKPIYPKDVAKGYVRFYLNPAWTNNGDGTASMCFYDLSEAKVSSNAAIATAIATAISSQISASNAAIAEAEYKSKSNTVISVGIK